MNRSNSIENITDIPQIECIVFIFLYINRYKGKLMYISRVTVSIFAITSLMKTLELLW